jgi:GT2 family glycosyltransferase
VRWLGRRRVEQYLERVYRAAKAEDPDGLVTYVNYPTTEYLQVPFLDLVCFNVYLEQPDRLEAYLARLQNLAGDRPLVMSELGLDSLRHGEEAQARALDWQIRATFAAGCAGAFVFAWTDEWFRAGADVDDWAFGLTRRDRRPKPALAAVGRAFSEAPAPADLAWPRISVVVCTHNGARTLRDCLAGLGTLAYPDFEVIVVDDGSRDATPDIAREYGCRLIRTAHRGLSAARNTGLDAATGEIVAYIDDDAYPDPHWLTYLASTFLTTAHAGVGGPNLPPPHDGPIADCVANAPGGPLHVLLSDREAEHIPGCNMAFRAACLRAIGGFDPQFRAAGDDVDVCWRLRDRGWTLGFSPAAVVWHHRRDSIRAYWRQQRGYGRAEALLARKWPDKYNGTGHVTWAGRLYGNGAARLGGWGSRIYHGVWGSAPFQFLYQPAPAGLWSLTAMPEWYLVILALGVLSALGALWRPLLLALPLLSLAMLAPVVSAGLGAARATFPGAPGRPAGRLARRLVTAALHVIQPLARLRGRLQHGLTPWRWHGAPGLSLPRPGLAAIWSDRWEDPDQRLRGFEARLKATGATVRRGGDYDRWDLEVSGGALGAARVLMAVEDHGAGAQLVRVRWWPRGAPGGLGLTAIFLALSGGAVAAEAWAAGAVLGVSTLLLALRVFLECAGASAVIRLALGQPGAGEV